MAFSRLYILSFFLFGCGEEEVPVDMDHDGFTVEMDCNDNDPNINPNAVERCDQVDNNCDGKIDDLTSIDLKTWYADGDGDGFGDASESTQSCSPADGYVEDNTDCDDTDSFLRPDDTDDDSFSTCDGDCDDDNPLMNPSDQDGDGFSSCDGDCNDSDPDWFPASESVELRESRIDVDGNGVDDILEEQRVLRDVDDNVIRSEYARYEGGVLTQSNLQYSTFNAAGNELTFAYEATDYVLRTTYKLNSSSTYDVDGRLLTQMRYTDHDGNGVTDSIIRVENIFNSAGQIEMSKNLNDTDADGRFDQVSLRSFGYNSDGDLVSIQYDANDDGRYDSVESYVPWYISSGDIVRREIYIDYDNDGVTDVKRLEFLDYDDRGNLVRRTLQQYSCGTCESVSQTAVFVTAFDDEDRIVSMVASYDWDGDTRPDTVYTENRAYDSSSNLNYLYSSSDHDGDGVVDYDSEWTGVFTNGTHLLSSISTTDDDGDGKPNYYLARESAFTWMCP